MLPLLKHSFPITDKYPPTLLTFPGLLTRTTFPSLAEAQSHAILRDHEALVLAPGLLDLDSKFDAIISRYERLKDELEGDEFNQVAKRYFMVNPPAQYKYRCELYTSRMETTRRR